MALCMSRRDRFLLRLIMGVALGTFIFAIWAFVSLVRSPSAPDLSKFGTTYDFPNSAK